MYMFNASQLRDSKARQRRLRLQCPAYTVMCIDSKAVRLWGRAARRHQQLSHERRFTAGRHLFLATRIGMEADSTSTRRARSAAHVAKRRRWCFPKSSLHESRRPFPPSRRCGRYGRALDCSSTRRERRKQAEQQKRQKVTETLLPLSDNGSLWLTSGSHDNNEAIERC